METFTEASPTPAPTNVVSDTEAAKGVPFEPHCLMTWQTQVAAMDETAGIRPETPQ